MRARALRAWVSHRSVRTSISLLSCSHSSLLGLPSKPAHPIRRAGGDDHKLLHWNLQFWCVIRRLMMNEFIKKVYIVIASDKTSEGSNFTLSCSWINLIASNWLRLAGYSARRQSVAFRRNTTTVLAMTKCSRWLPAAKSSLTKAIKPIHPTGKINETCARHYLENTSCVSTNATVASKPNMAIKNWS